MSGIRIFPAGDSAVTVSLGSRIDVGLAWETAELGRRIRETIRAGITEVVPAYCALLVCYDPGILSCEELTEKIRIIAASREETGKRAGRKIEIPVIYGGSFGEDLSFVAQYAGMSEDDVIRIHSSVEYPVYMLGFLPGFAYLGGMDERLSTPRLETPRMRIPEGSVGIGGAQTGIYPLTSPGGWRLIGRTPVRLYDPERENPILLRAGDTVRFVPIEEEEYKRIRQMEEEGTYVVSISEEAGE